MLRSLVLWGLASLAMGAITDGPLARRDRDRIGIAAMVRTYVFLANGSGVVVSADGLVLTNNHVIAGEHGLTVRFADGSSWPAQVLGTDPVGDIAVLRIKVPHPLAFAPMADESRLRPGIPVIAIGNPFGLGDIDDVPSVSHGVLSTGRTVRDDYTDAIQSDAPVNPGNSGGPLFDADGYLLGINGEIRTVSGMRINSGVGLAVACTQLGAFIPLLAQAKGLFAFHTAMPAGLSLTMGAGGVAVDTAEHLPLIPGDLLIRVAGRPVVSVEQAIGLFSSVPWRPGVRIAVRIRRAGEREPLDLELPAGRTPIPGSPYHGLTFESGEDGLVVSAVDPGSPGEAAGIVAGDIVLQAEHHPVHTSLDFLKIMVELQIGDILHLRVRHVPPLAAPAQDGPAMALTPGPGSEFSADLTIMPRDD